MCPAGNHVLGTCEDDTNWHETFEGLDQAGELRQLLRKSSLLNHIAKFAANLAFNRSDLSSDFVM